MSSENEFPRSIDKQVNEVFRETHGRTKKGRILLAAYAVGGHVEILRCLREERDEKYAHIPSAKAPSVAFYLLGFSGMIAPSEAELTDPPEEMDKDVLFSDIEKAEMARDASLDGVRALYGLSDRQARRALKLAEKRF